MYYVGQEINIGYYCGFHNQKLVKKPVEITAIDDVTGLIDIKIILYPPNKSIFRKMFGYASDLKILEENYMKER